MHYTNKLPNNYLQIDQHQNYIKSNNRNERSSRHTARALPKYQKSNGADILSLLQNANQRRLDQAWCLRSKRQTHSLLRALRSRASLIT